MKKKIAVYAVQHAEPPKWSFRRSEIDEAGSRVVGRRRVGYLLVPSNFEVFPDGANRPNRIHPELKLCLLRPKRNWLRLNVREAINRFGPVRED
ncbi:Uncharacterised protein [Burkholderia pseudomallei]|uniref:hypothetical protein n=1 Tax=Burkholderia pseudomallei TaxID=28450 RepID=UPI000F105ACF|nr:hypothetical protein [Burkholderia pseudomallei]VCT41701.1 Uncharacterised protein [Burkholderia pseudomallei]VCT44957.1 Uncharacterised protein [Burkholderia pseudomallei]VCT49809.1 Uncharacterised protein [Burkholderia pseudomallei]VCT59343.1 Uncharacterised protein [Burkholderia pseudomallei]VCT71490.1 Uncharacterised protein [Burkholderia pseudomallei]